MKKLIYLITLITLSTSLLMAQKAGRKEVDPDPEEFLMMDKGAELDRRSLMKAFVYPDSAHKAGIQGTVTLKVLIGKTGKPERYIIVEPVHPMLDSAAATAVMKATYKAAIYDSDPIKSWMEIPIIFKIGTRRALPIVISGPEETGGYLRAKYNMTTLYEALNKDILHSGPKDEIKISIEVDEKGKVSSIKNSSKCPDNIFEEISRALREIEFQPSIKNNEYAVDRFTLLIDPFFK